MADLEQNKYGGTIRKLQILRLVLVVVAVALAAALIVVRIFFFTTKELPDKDDSSMSSGTLDIQDVQPSESNSEPQIPLDQEPLDDSEENLFNEDPSDAPEEGEADPSEEDPSDAPEEDEADPSEEEPSDAPEEDEADPSEEDPSDAPEEDEADPSEEEPSDAPEEGGTGLFEQNRSHVSEEGEVDPSEEDPSDVPEVSEVDPSEEDSSDVPKVSEVDPSEEDPSDAPEEGEVDPSEEDPSDIPEEGEEGLFEQNKSDAPEEGEANPSGKDKSDTPKKDDNEDEGDSKDDTPEAIIPGDQNDDNIENLPNTGFGLPENSDDEETPVNGGTEDDREELTNNPDVGRNSIAMTAFIVLSVLLGIDAVAVIVLSIIIIKKKRMNIKSRIRTERIVPDMSGSARMEATAGKSPQKQFSTNKVAIGKLHNIGARPYQEDSSGLVELNDGVLAIVADGMGGLSGGDKVSQKIVFTMISYGESLKSGQMDGVLTKMVDGVNEVVNKMLGPNGLYKSGSTLLAVLVRQHRFHWVAVGDSHIYLYHRDCLTQLNQEHDREQELLKRAAQGEISFEQAKNDSKKSGLTSFIGMGKLKYIDKSLVSIPVEQGDRIILMTDGVFNAVSDQEIASVLKKCPDVSEAAAELERMVIRRANPKQDNFTAVILGI